MTGNSPIYRVWNEKVETIFREKGLWIPALDQDTPGTSKRRFYTDFRYSVYQYLKPQGLVQVVDAVARITDKGMRWLEGKAEPYTWHKHRPDPAKIKELN